MQFLLVLLCLLWWAPSHAVTYYVATTGNNGNSCAQAQSESTPKLTIPSGVGCMVGGDTLIIKAGTYSGQEITNPPAGSDSSYTVIKADPAGARPVLAPNGANVQRGLYCSNGAACHHIELRGFEITGAYNSVKLAGNDTVGYAHHIRLIDNIMHDTVGSQVLISTSATGFLGGDHLIQHNELYRSGVGSPGYAQGINTIYNPGNRSIVEKNVFHNLANGVGIWGQGIAIQGVTVRGNVFYDINRNLTDTWQVPGGSAIHVSSNGGGHQIYNNVVYQSGDASSFGAIKVQLHAIADMGNIYNNTIYDLKHGSAYGIAVYTGTVAVKNNIAYLAGAGITGGTQSNNLTTNPSFRNAAGADFSLLAGSPAINAGVDVGLPYNGAAPDIGAHETVGTPTATINGVTLSVTFPMSLNTPIQIPGNTGWSVACTPNPSACGTVALSAASRRAGSDTVVDLTLSGISGGYCVSGQTWTVSYNSSTGTASDSANIGTPGQYHQQYILSFTDLAVTNSCSGAPPPPPGGPYIHYLLDGNANDSSGGGRHGTTSGGTWVSARFDQGFQTTAGLDEYVEAPYLSGVNPTATSLTIAYGVYIDTANIGLTKNTGGVGIGTNQRFYVYTAGGTWRMGIQAKLGIATELPVAEGWNRVFVTFDSGTSTATLCVNGQTGATTDGSVFTYTSYTFPNNMRFGLPNGIATSLAGSHLYDDAEIWQSVESCSDDYAAWSPPAPPQAGQYKQVAHQFQYVSTTSGGDPVNAGVLNGAYPVVDGGAVAIVFQVDCIPSTNCDATGFRLQGSTDAVNWVAVPNMPTVDGYAFYGTIALPTNIGSADGPITGGYPCVDGPTVTTAASIPSVTLAHSNSVTLRYLLQFSPGLTGQTRYFRLVRDDGNVLAGGYTPATGAQVTIIGAQGNAGP